MTPEEIAALVAAAEAWEAEFAAGTAPEAVAAKNGRELLAKARTALDANATYLAIATPTNAQVAAQVKALTRQNNALLRLVAQLLDDTSDT